MNFPYRGCHKYVSFESPSFRAFPGSSVLHEFAIAIKLLHDIVIIGTVDGSRLNSNFNDVNRKKAVTTIPVIEKKY